MRVTFKAFDEMSSLDELTESPYQTNQHSQTQIEQLAKIMREHGVSHPIHVTEGTTRICFGHARKEAALLNGWSTFPIVYQSFESDDEEKVKVTSDNAIALQSELDFSKVNAFNIDLGPDFDTDLWGIKNFEIEPADKHGLCDEDEVPDHVEPKTKLGDVYQLGSHRLMCGDSTSIDAVEKLMAGEKADMVYCDPPYGMKLDTKRADMKGTWTRSTRDYKPVIGDDGDFDPGILLGYFDYCPEVFLWGADYYAERLVNKNKGSWIVWDKRQTEELDAMWGSQFELCWSKNKHKRELARITWAGVLGHSKKDDGDSKVHPTMKPVKLHMWFFDKYKGTKVVDLFGGSGSTLIACEKTNRKCFMMELDPHYCDVIVARWEKYTGQKSQLLTAANSELTA